MAFAVVLFIIGCLGVGGAELVRNQCRRMLTAPSRPARRRQPVAARRRGSSGLPVRPKVTTSVTSAAAPLAAPARAA
jgi:hypothetical protein